MGYAATDQAGYDPSRAGRILITVSPAKRGNLNHIHQPASLICRFLHITCRRQPCEVGCPPQLGEPRGDPGRHKTNPARRQSQEMSDLLGLRCTGSVQIAHKTPEICPRLSHNRPVVLAIVTNRQRGRRSRRSL